MLCFDGIAFVESAVSCRDDRIVRKIGLRRRKSFFSIQTTAFVWTINAIDI